MTDLDRFPQSESAKRMLTYVTRGWYDKSYVGKWIYEVMGREVDAASVYVEDLPYQFFPETATWGLRYHELKYGLPVREDLTYEERRRKIREKRDTKAPMTPWRMERIIEDTTGYLAEVHDINESGYTFDHPNIFSVRLSGESELNMGAAFRKINTLKQSHTIYELYIPMITIQLQEMVDVRPRYRMDFPWWGAVLLDGSIRLDGSAMLGFLYPLQFGHTHRIHILTAVSADLKKIRARMQVQAELTMVGIQKNIYRIAFPWNYAAVLDGLFNLDGTIKLNVNVPPYWGTRIRVPPVNHNETFAISMYNPLKHCFLNGVKRMDGSIKLNSQKKEVL